jgi:predicted TIM-barrel fold metal-dependent hydrolase
VVEMRIDAHAHLVDRGWINDSFFLGLSRITAATLSKDTGIGPDAVQLMELMMPAFADRTGEQLVRTMDEGGIDKTVICAIDFGYLAHHARVPIQEQNQAVAEAAEKYADRLIPFFAVDPRRPEAVEWFERAIEDWKVRGLKLHPAVGFNPGDPECHPLYETCMEHDLPVLIHSGSQPAPFRSSFTRPASIDDFAADYPTLKIIMAHVGHNWWEEALLVGSVKPNVHFDFSGWQRAYRQRPELFYRMLRRLLDEVGPWRVFFGTDGPYLNALCPVRDWVAAVESPDLSSCPDITFSDDEKKIIMGESFERLIGGE